MTKENTVPNNDVNTGEKDTLDMEGKFYATIAGKLHTLKNPNIYHINDFERTAMGQIVDRGSTTERTGNFTAAFLNLWKMCVESVGDIKGSKLHEKGVVDARCKIKVAQKLWDVTCLTHDEVVSEFGKEALVDPDKESGTVSDTLYLKVFQNGKYILTAHTLTFPDDEDILEYERIKTDAKTVTKKNKKVITPGTMFGPRIQMYNRLFVSARGYANNTSLGIPLIHKIEAMEYFLKDSTIEIEETEGN